MRSTIIISSILLSTISFSSSAFAENMCSQVFGGVENAAARQRKPLTPAELANRKRVLVVKVGNSKDISKFTRDSAALFTYENQNTSPAYIVEDMHKTTKNYRLNDSQYLMITSLKLSSAKDLQKSDPSIQIISSAEKFESPLTSKFSNTDRFAIESMSPNQEVSVQIYFKTQDLPDFSGFDKKSLVNAIQKAAPDIKFSDVYAVMQYDYVLVETKVTKSQLVKLNGIKSVSNLVLEDNTGISQIESAVYAAKDELHKQKRSEKAAAKAVQSSSSEGSKTVAAPSDLPANLKIAEIEQYLPQAVQEGKQKVFVTFTGSKKEMEEFKLQYISIALKETKARSSSVYEDMMLQGGTFDLGDGKLFASFPLRLESAKSLEKINSKMSVYLETSGKKDDARGLFKKVSKRQADVLARAGENAHFPVRVYLNEQPTTLNTTRDVSDKNAVDAFAKAIPGIRFEKIESQYNHNTNTMTPIGILHGATAAQIKHLGNVSEVKSLDISIKDFDSSLDAEIRKTESQLRSAK